MILCRDFDVQRWILYVNPVNCLWIYSMAYTFTKRQVKTIHSAWLSLLIIIIFVIVSPFLPTNTWIPIWQIPVIAFLNLVVNLQSKGLLHNILTNNILCGIGKTSRITFSLHFIFCYIFINLAQKHNSVGMFIVCLASIIVCTGLASYIGKLKRIFNKVLNA